MTTRNLWEDFKRRTSIHGFGEYYGMRTPFAKAAWLVLCLCVGVLSISQLVWLSIGYFEHQPVTMVDVVHAMALPYIAIGLTPEPYARQLASKYPFLANLVGKSGAEERSCTGQPEAHKVFSPKLIRDFNREYLSMIPKPQDLFHNDRVRDSINFELYHEDRSGHPRRKGGIKDGPALIAIVGKGDATPIRNATVFLSAQGPKYLFHTSHIKTTEVIHIVIPINTLVTGGSKILIFIGTDALKHDDTLGKPVFLSQPVLDLNLVRYVASSRYCDHSDEKLGCVGQCRLAAARIDKRCTPYLGSYDANLPICGSGDVDYCHKNLGIRHEGCEENHKQHTCDEVVGMLTVTGESLAGFPYGNDVIILQIPPHAGFQEFHKREALSPVAFLSQVGGLLGLCFGISIVSICHFLYSATKVVMASRRTRIQPVTITWY